jgi:uracil-DNA glycosylase
MTNPIPWNNLKYLWDTDDMIAIKNITNQTPNKKDIFKAYSECPYDQVKVVIIGQDPYSRKGVANGLAFDCSNSDYHFLQPSLESIYLAAKREDIDVDMKADLSYLAKQGVLLLNSALTVRIDDPGSHQDMWKFFILATIEELNKKDNLVFLLYGNAAKAFKPHIKHKVFESCHPVADVYSFSSPKFYTHWNETNEFLISTNQETIIWNQELTR